MQDSEAGDALTAAAGDAAEALAREDWMTKAMPRAKAEAPQLDSAAEEAPEQPKKVPQAPMPHANKRGNQACCTSLLHWGLIMGSTYPLPCNGSGNRAPASQCMEFYFGQ